EVDNEFEFGGLFEWYITRLFALQDLVGEDYDAREVRLPVGSVAHQHACLRLIAWNEMLGSRCFCAAAAKIARGNLGDVRTTMPVGRPRPTPRRASSTFMTGLNSITTVSSPFARAAVCAISS